jgi:two-component system, OmpR family, KDP operon response regulator KdpE
METGENVSEGRLVRGDLVVDFEKHAVLVEGSDVHLTQNELRIVSLIAKHSGQVLTYSYLLEQIWGHFAACDRQLLRVNMANIRRKIENDPSQPKYIVTEVGIGYQMVEEPGGTPA